LKDQINKGLVCYDISKTFTNHKALIDVDLSVEEGDILTILGPSGCGKTTLLRIIAGLELPDKGRIFLDSTEITRLPASKREINTVFQSYALFPHLDVYSNVSFGLQARKTPKDKIEKKVKDILSLIQMEGLEKRFPNQLSGGQKQRVALARALVNEPRLLLLDEPLSALDAHLRSQVQQELRALQQKLGTTFVLVTHDHNETKRLSNRLVVMNEGEIIQSGPTADVFARPANKFVAEFLGATNFMDASKMSDTVFDTPYGPMDVKNKPKWDKGKMFVWPEKIEIHNDSAPAGNNWFVGFVKDQVFNGEGLDLMLVKDRENDLPIEPLLVRVNTRLDVQSGQRLAVYIPPEHLVPLENPIIH
jgi:spermidine/putrescine transport system ATP-binding protein